MPLFQALKDLFDPGAAFKEPLTAEIAENRPEFAEKTNVSPRCLCEICVLWLEIPRLCLCVLGLPTSAPSAVKGF